MLRCCKEDDSQKDNTANSCKDDNPSTYEDGYLSTYEDVNDIPANNISNPMHDPEVLKLEMEKVNARDRVIAEKLVDNIAAQRTWCSATWMAIPIHTPGRIVLYQSLWSELLGTPNHRRHPS